jgi:hypothetical protein
MTKQIRQVNIEHFLYALAFGLALGLRLLNLGDAPLSDFEAGWAIQSWNAVQGEPVAIGPNPAYFALTTLVFYLFGSSNALARLWPALVGGLVVLAPFGFRRWSGREAALIMAFGLALDPGMVALSRLAGGPMLAIGFGAIALAFIYSRKPAWSGIFGGLALISGPSVYHGLIGFLIAYGVARLAGLRPEWGVGPSQKPAVSLKNQIPTVLTFGVLTILMVSTLFTRFPNGLGAWGGSLVDYFQGWLRPSGVPVVQPILAVVTYQPLALILAFIAAVRGWARGENKIRWLSVWVLVVLLSSLSYPGRVVYDAAWTLLPLWALAAVELARYLKLPQPSTAAYGQAGIIFVLGALFWLISLYPDSSNSTWLILVVVPVLVVLTTILVGLGWSWEAARSGLIWGLSAVFGIYVLAAMFGASQVVPNSPRELWTPSPGIEQAAMLESTLQELAIIQNGREDSIQIVSLVDAQSLKWALRDFSEVTYISTLDPNHLPSVIITLEDGSDLSQTMA